MIVHEGQKPYVCDACGKAFGMKQGLKEHYIIVHEKNGKLKCHQCNFTAPNNSRLRFHIQTVHEKNPYLNVPNVHLHVIARMVLKPMLMQFMRKKGHINVIIVMGHFSYEGTKKGIC